MANTKTYFSRLNPAIDLCALGIRPGMAVILLLAMAMFSHAHASDSLQMLPPTPLGNTSSCPSGEMLMYSGATSGQAAINCVPVTSDSVGNLNVGSDLIVQKDGVFQGGLSVAKPVSIGTSAPKELLDVAGNIKIGNSPAPGNDCDADHAGAMRFNAVNHKFEGCDGTSWGPISGADSSDTVIMTDTNLHHFKVPSSMTWAQSSQNGNQSLHQFTSPSLAISYGNSDTSADDVRAAPTMNVAFSFGYDPSFVGTIPGDAYRSGKQAYYTLQIYSIPPNNTVLPDSSPCGSVTDAQGVTRISYIVAQKCVYNSSTWSYQSVVIEQLD